MNLRPVEDAGSLPQDFAVIPKEELCFGKTH